MIRGLVTLTIVLAFTLPAQGHFIWLAPDTNQSVRVVFSEDTDPDERVPITKIAQTKIYQRGAEKTPLPMKQGKSAYHVPVQPGRTTTLGGICVYGVLAKGDTDPFLLAYYPKAVLGGAMMREQAAKPWGKLPLDIVVDLNSGKCSGKVLWQGKPAGGAEVIVLSPGQSRVKTVTIDSGAFTFPAPKEKGLITIRARVIENNAGKHMGKAYKEAKHYATLTIPANAVTSGTSANAGGENRDATQLLKDARTARATWKNFPGFSADLTVNHNGEVIRGSVRVDPTGTIEMKGFQPGALKSKVRRQVSSLVMHRISNAAGRETPCRFAGANADHPLGRKILVLNDELHSSYRIRDRQIIEVNRRMKNTRFTITVLKNYETANKKFLPASYVVNVWGSQNNQLVSSTAHYNSWKSVGEYDLPQMITIVTATGGEPPAAGNFNATDAIQNTVQPSNLEALTLTFSNLQLLKR